MRLADGAKGGALLAFEILHGLRIGESGELERNAPAESRVTQSLFGSTEKVIGVK